MSQLKLTGPVSSGSSTYLELVLTQPRSRSTSESAVKASWRCGRHSPIRFSFVLQLCSGRTTRSSPPCLICSAGFRSIQCSGVGSHLPPVYVEDVAEAVAAALQCADTDAATFECGGPRIYTYADFLRTVTREAGLKSILIPFPFAAWHALAWMSERLPKPSITRNQIELMQIDTISSLERPGLAELGISPHAVEEILREMLTGR